MSTAILAVAVAAALVVVVPMSSAPITSATFALAGIANSLFFAATLAARSEYAPAEARGQVFIWVGALKIAAGSAGTATAGAISGGIVWLSIALVAGATAVSAGICAVERRLRRD